jgi:hypothetical protein
MNERKTATNFLMPNLPEVKTPCAWDGTPNSVTHITYRF